MIKKFVIPTIIILIIAVLLSFIFDWGRKDEIPTVDQNTVTTSTVEQVSTSTTEMPIVVNNIKDNQIVSNPIIIKGKARGNWFFEASFPVQLVDTDGNIMATAVAQAESDWMTTDFVNFTATLNYVKSTSTDRALIVLSNDNPSGNPELDRSILIPVILK
jgi:hypothetical protein